MLTSSQNKEDLLTAGLTQLQKITHLDTEKNRNRLRANPSVAKEIGRVLNLLNKNDLANQYNFNLLIEKPFFAVFIYVNLLQFSDCTQKDFIFFLQNSAEKDPTQVRPYIKAVRKLKEFNVWSPEVQDLLLSHWRHSDEVTEMLLVLNRHQKPIPECLALLNRWYNLYNYKNLKESLAACAHFFQAYKHMDNIDNILRFLEHVQFRCFNLLRNMCRIQLDFTNDTLNLLCVLQDFDLLNKFFDIYPSLDSDNFKMIIKYPEYLEYIASEFFQRVMNISDEAKPYILGDDEYQVHQLEMLESTEYKKKSILKKILIEAGIKRSERDTEICKQFNERIPGTNLFTPPRSIQEGDEAKGSLIEIILAYERPSAR